MFKNFRQNAELFSKLAFARGKYDQFDMTELDIANIRDYATFMALTSNSKGRNGEVALKNFDIKIGNSSWAEFCQKQLAR